MDSEKAICPLDGVGWGCFTHNPGQGWPLLPSFYSTDASAPLTGCSANPWPLGQKWASARAPTPSPTPLTSHVSSPPPSRKPPSTCHHQPCQQSSWDPSDPAQASASQPDPHSPRAGNLRHSLIHHAGPLALSLPDPAAQSGFSTDPSSYLTLLPGSPSCQPSSRNLRLSSKKFGL